MTKIAAIIMFVLAYATVAYAGTFYTNKPSCVTTCYTDSNGVTHCTTVCSGGYN